MLIRRSGYNTDCCCRSHHPDLAIPRLPLQPALWVSSYQSVSLQLASFLAQLLTIKELLSSKAPCRNIHAQTRKYKRCFGLM